MEKGIEDRIVWISSMTSLNRVLIFSSEDVCWMIFRRLAEKESSRIKTMSTLRSIDDWKWSASTVDHSGRKGGIGRLKSIPALRNSVGLGLSISAAEGK